MPYDLGPLFRSAVRRSGGQGTGVFSTEAFRQAVRAEFDLERTPDEQWCVDILINDVRVKPMTGARRWGGGHWLLTGDAGPAAP